MWAQNRPRDFWHPRITWPSDSGGGTNAGVAVKELAGKGVSAGLFAPAWTRQHFRGVEQRRNVERAVWVGEELEVVVKCDCRPGWFDPKDPHRTAEYQDIPLVRSARQFPAGSERYFRTNFHQGFTRRKEDGLYVSELGKQSVLPIPQTSAQSNLIWELDAYHQSLVISIDPNFNTDADGYDHVMLYNTDIMTEGKTMLNVWSRSLDADAVAHIVLIVLRKEGTQALIFLMNGILGETHKLEANVIAQGRIVELGVMVKPAQAAARSKTELLHVLELLDIEIQSEEP